MRRSSFIKMCTLLGIGTPLVVTTKGCQVDGGQDISPDSRVRIANLENWIRVRTLGESLADKIFFVGDAYTVGEDWSSIHPAGRSAVRTAADIFR